MFVLNPDPYSLPCYRIGPFRTMDLAINHNLPENNLIDYYFNERFTGKDFIYTENGRKAINMALEFLHPQKEDIVTILTTTGNFYISGCVTKEIEKFCKWSREILPETKIIFVNHEFGHPFPGLNELKKYNLPIIEDCAASFFSDDPDHTTGNTGDFVIYSFPKMFPLQVGGLLVSNVPGRLKTGNQVEGEFLQHVKNILSYYISDKESIINKRITNYNFLKNKFESLGFLERFNVTDGTVPGVFMFRTNGQNMDLPELKQHFYAHGIQCSVFYGEDAFFIPCHQNLTPNDLLYLVEVFKAALKNHSNK